MPSWHTVPEVRIGTATVPASRSERLCAESDAGIHHVTAALTGTQTRYQECVWLRSVAVQSVQQVCSPVTCRYLLPSSKMHGGWNDALQAAAIKLQLLERSESLFLSVLVHAMNMYGEIEV